MSARMDPTARIREMLRDGITNPYHIFRKLKGQEYSPYAIEQALSANEFVVEREVTSAEVTLLVSRSADETPARLTWGR